LAGVCREFNCSILQHRNKQRLDLRRLERFLHFTHMLPPVYTMSTTDRLTRLATWTRSACSSGDGRPVWSLSRRFGYHGCIDPVGSSFFLVEAPSTPFRAFRNRWHLGWQSVGRTRWGRILAQDAIDCAGWPLEPKLRQALLSRRQVLHDAGPAHSRRSRRSRACRQHMTVS